MRWRDALGAPRPRVAAVAVDHGLRPESRAEAAAALARAEALGAEPVLLAWEGAKPEANLQAAAREARYRLLGAWRRAEGVGLLLLGHNRDDVGETFLLRLARGSGVDGLARMAARRWEEPPERALAEARPRLRLARPLLDVSRADLRAYCRARGVAWVEDPSNADPRFDRVKARAALVALAPLGLDAERLAHTAETMARARAALEAAVEALFAAAGRADRALGVATLERRALLEAPEEIALRLLARALEWAAGACYPPRLRQLEGLYAALAAGERAQRTLHGAAATLDAEAIRIAREAAAVGPRRDLAPGAAVLWDGRFEATARAPGLSVAALGPAYRRALDALGQAPDGPPAALAALPGVWRGDALVATPLGGDGALAALSPREPFAAGRRLRE